MAKDIKENSEVIKEELRNFQKKYVVEEIGTVTSIIDGVATIYGLGDVFFNEVVRFEIDKDEGGVDVEESIGLVMSIGGFIKALVLKNPAKVRSGMIVKRTKKVIEVPVGKKLLGRVVDALGNPIDGKGELEYEAMMPVERKAPGVIQRKSVHEPMSTGYKVIDSLIPIGRGQRQLIIGDRSTGKTALCIDTILNQKESHKSANTHDKLYCI